ncbi:DUF4188 domain-containing protein [Guptibacillus algicola]|uniref:DUF4188 domain-containing protein n=1 Tax=Guptibacillus algicola TaxID=225844 RepID=UPI001CD1EF41|nr:DUF4188 domain-containing protein [Alkalihalobacillus algicola]MCA0986770.1 DUF4188 domain-containing protein [Alkalihalobacillus algicola]
MSKEVFPGRYTAEEKQDVVVFVIGMRVNKWWAIHKWLPVFAAMPGMIKELLINKSLGCLSMESFFGRTTLMIQYWRSTEDLLSYAHGEKHLTAWKNFNKRVGDNKAVGIYHETYIVPKDNSECIYGNMPKFGLSKALGHTPITSKSSTAKKRLRPNHQSKSEAST